MISNKFEYDRMLCYFLNMITLKVQYSRFVKDNKFQVSPQLT